MASSALDLGRVLITGGEGMIGRALPFGVKIGRRDLDVTDAAQVAAAMRRQRPSAIVHLAALDIRQAEADPMHAYATNVVGAYHLACAARAARIPLLFLSSGAVFAGGPGEVHDEEAAPRPLNLYGQTKWVAELLLAETLDDLIIVRTGWVFGGPQAHHPKFVDRAIALARRGEPIQATVDQTGSPTAARDLAAEIARLLVEGERGLVHVVNAGHATGAEMAREIVDALGSRSPVQPVRGQDLADPGPPRPASEALTSLRVRLRPWQEALRAYVAEQRGAC